MADRGSTYYAPTGETTEWDDILINKGILDEDEVLRGKGIDPNERRLEEAVSKAREAEIERIKSRTVEDKLAGASLEEMDEMEDDFDDDGMLEKYRARAALRALAPRFKEVKFVEIKSVQAVEKWPESNLPTLFIYKDGSLATQLIRIEALGGKQMKPVDLEWYLASRGIIETELEENPRRTRGTNSIHIRRGARGRGRGGGSDKGDEEEEEGGDDF